MVEKSYSAQCSDNYVDISVSKENIRVQSLNFPELLQRWISLQGQQSRCIIWRWEHDALYSVFSCL